MIWWYKDDVGWPWQDGGKKAAHCRVAAFHCSTRWAGAVLSGSMGSLCPQSELCAPNQIFIKFNLTFGIKKMSDYMLVLCQKLQIWTCEWLAPFRGPCPTLTLQGGENHPLLCVLQYIPHEHSIACLYLLLRSLLRLMLCGSQCMIHANIHSKK